MQLKFLLNTNFAAKLSSHVDSFQGQGLKIQQHLHFNYLSHLYVTACLLYFLLFFVP